jgi:hypothetical protein
MHGSLVSVVLIAAVITHSACTTAPEEPTHSVVGRFDPELKCWAKISDGTSSWSWRDGQSGGEANLAIDGSGYRWRFDGVPAGTLRLAPRDASWHTITVADAFDLAGIPPLPRLAVATTAYPDLVTMARDLTSPRFESIVTHWPRWPVPVSSPPAVSGENDLAACLREAVAIWNDDPARNMDAGKPWFEWRPGADWGIRLAHYAGSDRHPPLSLSITRRDELGRPRRMRISVGDNYDSAAARPYLVRGLVHELAHALLLWGHTPDRQHILWGEAPPLRDDPSRDERRCARLLRLLPLGLDLATYGVAPGALSTGHQAIRGTGRPSSNGNVAAIPDRASEQVMASRGGGSAAVGSRGASTAPAPDDRSASSMVRSSQLSSRP